MHGWLGLAGIQRCNAGACHAEHGLLSGSDTRSASGCGWRRKRLGSGRRGRRREGWRRHADHGARELARRRLARRTGRRLAGGSGGSSSCCCAGRRRERRRGHADHGAAQVGGLGSGRGGLGRRRLRLGRLRLGRVHDHGAAETRAGGGQIQATARAERLLVEVLRAAAAALLHLAEDYSVFGPLSRGSRGPFASRQAGGRSQGFCPDSPF